MRDDRRRFLRVFGATAVGLALPACSGGADPSTSKPIDGAGGGGAGGAGVSASGSSGTGVGGEGGAGPCGGPAGVSAGPPSAFSEEGLHKVSGTKFLIGRDANGIYAMSSICTHAFCNMNNISGGQPLGVMNPKGPTSGAICNCHGSTFTADGDVIAGPAKSPLAHFAVALCDGALVVDLQTQVDPTTRLMV